MSRCQRCQADTETLLYTVQWEKNAVTLDGITTSLEVSTFEWCAPCFDKISAGAEI